MMKKKKKLSKAGRIILDLLLVLSLGTAAYSGYRLWKETEKYRVSEKSYSEIRETVIVRPEKPHGQNEPEEKKIDWDALKALNPDFFAWIELEGSSIDYPVIQGSDNEWYLKHLPDGTYNDAGTIFADYENKTDFSDRVTVLYGHHMLEEPLMFAEVENYENQSWYDSHRKFLIHTPDTEYEMYPLAGYVTCGDAGYIRISFEDDEDFMNYVNDFIEKSDFVSDQTVSPSDHIVMLSTCSYDIYDGRYVLIGRLEKIS
jgi:sortase B